MSGSYRMVDETVEGSYAFSVSPNEMSESVFNVFVQDEVSVGRQIKLTFGTKVERDSYVGWGFELTPRPLAASRDAAAAGVLAGARRTGRRHAVPRRCAAPLQRCRVYAR